MKKNKRNKRLIIILPLFTLFVLAIICLQCSNFRIVRSFFQSNKEFMSNGTLNNNITVSSNYNENAADLVQQILGNGLTATDITKDGTVYSFSDGLDAIGIDSGIVLDTSGRITSSKQDADLKKLMEYTYGGDTSSMEFSMIATGTLLNFNYVFASTEFDQPVKYNDIFGLFVSVNGGSYENIATITQNSGRKVPVNISNLKAGLSGNELTGAPTSSKEYSLFTAKNINIGAGTNGVSNVFNAQKQVNIGDVIKIKFVIADVSDKSYNSYVMIESSSLSFEKPVAEISYKQEALSNLESRVPYKIIANGTTYEITSKADGQIPLSGKDTNNKNYSFFNKNIEVIKSGYGKIPDSDPQSLYINERPASPENIAIYTTLTQETPLETVKITKNSIKFVANENQQYSLDKQEWLSADKENLVSFSNITSPTSTIYTRYTATDTSFASESSTGSSVILKDSVKDILTINNYENFYDGNNHSSYAQGEGVTVSYSETLNGTYTNIPTSYKNAGIYKIYYYATKEGYYSYQGELTCTIKQKEITPKITLPQTTYVYTSKAITPAITITDNGKQIPISEYQIAYYDNINVGIAKISISNQPNGNYIINDTFTPFTITKKELSDLKVELSKEKYTYDGTDKKPQVKIYDGEELITEDKYTVTYANNRHASTLENPATVTITSKENSNYSFSTTRAFIINKLTITTSAFTSNDTLTYTGNTHTPLVIVRDTLGNIVSDKEYITTYSNNINVGKASILITSNPTSDYEFTCNTNFTINPKIITNPTFIIENNQYIYDGTERKPSINIYDGTTLINPTSYETTYSDNINAGVAKIKVKNNNTSNYIFEKEQTFIIAPKDLINPTVVLESEIYEYNGSEIRPKVSIYDNNVLINSSLYELSYKNNISFGIATIILKSTENSNYKFLITKSFEIKSAGNILKTQEISNVGNAAILDSEEDLTPKIPVTIEEKNLRAKGNPIFAHIKVDDISDSIPTSDKLDIVESLEDKNVVGLYLDINLSKKQSGTEEQALTQTNGKIKIGIEIPDHLINEGRKYSVVRVHEGVVSILDVEMLDNDILTFETDQFSTYAIVYKDKETEKNESIVNQSQPTETTFENPVTSDSVIKYMILLVGSGASAITSVSVLKKKIRK